MDVVERLTSDQVDEVSLIAMTHRHRYELAAELVAGMRVLDLCCGSGYGSEVLAATAASVAGVDVDDGAIADANRRYGDAGITFEQGDATEILGARLADRFDAIVMFEGLEHVSDLEATTAGLRRQADDGLLLVVSLPNSIPFGEENPHHETEFDQRTALATFERVGRPTILRQFHAEGSLIRGDGDGPLAGGSRLAERVEPDHCNHFIALFNVGDDLSRTVSAQIRVVVAPQQNTYMLDLERANKRLWRTNQELARERLGKADSAAAALLAKVPPELADGAPPQSRWEPLFRIGRRLRTAFFMVIPHGFLVLHAKIQGENAADDGRGEGRPGQ